jgi:hypothetical protein
MIIIFVLFGAEAKELPSHHWRFVPHPHRGWSQKYEPWACTWHTDFNSQGSDDIVNALLREGYCLHDVDSSPVYLLSSAQARSCLANRTVIVSGDSYTIQLFIGLADILSGVPNETEIVGPLRRQILAVAKAQMRQIGMDVRFVCENPTQCYGQGSSLDACARCLNEQTADVRVVGTTVHLLERGFVSANASIVGAVARVNRLLWISGPAYNQKLIPNPYNGTMPLRQTQHIYALTLGPTGYLAQANRSVSFLDIMSMSRACYAQWKNCSADGGHNSRFVERMKATMLLNILCEPIP